MRATAIIMWSVIKIIIISTRTNFNGDFRESIQHLFYIRKSLMLSIFFFLSFIIQHMYVEAAAATTDWKNEKHRNKNYCVYSRWVVDKCDEVM